MPHPPLYNIYISNYIFNMISDAENIFINDDFRFITTSQLSELDSTIFDRDSIFSEYFSISIIFITEAISRSYRKYTQTAISI
jgi:hypothetical protein